jgi:hypothetical protein
MHSFNQNNFDVLVVKTFKSEDCVCNELKNLANAYPDQWLFRGQQQRYIRYWPPEDISISQWTFWGKHSIAMESLVPIDYRDMENAIANGICRKHLEWIYGQRIANVRSFLTTYLIQCHSKWHSYVVQSWYNGLQNASKSAKLLSIGQHYGLRSCYLDVTYDWQVAVWFATHDWKTGEHIKSDTSVIYVFNIPNLRKASNCLETFQHPRNLVDIRDTPSELAPRAKAQQGGSIIGIESPIFLQELIHKKAIECWEFKSGHTQSNLNSLQKYLLVPPCDEMARIYNIIRGVNNPSNRQWNAFLNWVTINYPGINATQDDHNYLFA